MVRELSHTGGTAHVKFGTTERDVRGGEETQQQPHRVSQNKGPFGQNVGVLHIDMFGPYWKVHYGQPPTKRGNELEL